MVKKKKRGEQTPNELLVYVLVSPTVCIRSGGNLTGTPRVVRDLVIEMWSATQRWNSQLLSGTAVISQLSHVLLSKVTNDADSAKQRRNEKIRLSSDLASICEKMESFVSELEHQCDKLLRVQRLDEFRDNRNPLFLTWPAFKFAETSRRVYEMYANELRLKMSIAQEVAFCDSDNDRHTITLYVAAWLYRPYFEAIVDSNFSAMIKEVGHVV